MTRGNMTNSWTRDTRGAIGNKSSSSCSYATINKKEMGQRCARSFTGRWREGSPGGINSTIVGVAAMMTTMQRRQRQRQRRQQATEATWEGTRLRLAVGWRDKSGRQKA